MKRTITGIAIILICLVVAHFMYRYVMSPSGFVKDIVDAVTK